jgi:uncharacterized protein (DUF849 family)
MMKKLIIEARINEYMSRDQNPNVPWLPEEIGEDAARCREEGASVVHFHARAADGGADHSADAGAEERLASVMELARDPATRPDFAPMDMGSVNVDWYDPEGLRFETKNLVYRNDTETLEYFAKNITAAGLKQYQVAWNVSFIRQHEAFMDMGLIPEPAYLLLLLSDGIMLAGHPGTPAGLDAYTAFLPKHKRVEWTVCNYNGDLLRVTEKIIREGGHVSIGLGDYPYAEHGAPSNAELIRKIRQQAQALGREVATVEDTRDILGMG